MNVAILWAFQHNKMAGILQHNNIATRKYCNVEILQYNNIATQQTVQHYCNIYCNTLSEHNIAMQQTVQHNCNVYCNTLSEHMSLCCNKHCETTLRANNPKNYHTLRLLRREQDTSVLERKPKESSNGEPLGAGLQQYIYYTTRVLCEAIHEAVRLYEAMLTTSRDTVCTARGCGPDRPTGKAH